MTKTGLAYDLGCGVGTAAIFFAELGFTVIAIDHHPTALEIATERLASYPAVSLIDQDINLTQFEPCQLVHCGFVLFFLSKSEKLELIDRIEKALIPGGIFIGQLLGPQDDWSQSGYSSITDEEFTELAQRFATLHHEHITREGSDIVSGTKFWDIHHFVFQKPE